jgi:glycosyltransferase involved in cell wall biosynthesis
MIAKIAVFHNVVWSRYKGSVFSELHELGANSDSVYFEIYQIAETEKGRVDLSNIDYSYHRYPMNLIFKGCYEDIPIILRIVKLFWKIVTLEADLVILPGYHRPEYWGMLAGCVLSGKKRAVFCDSTALEKHGHAAKALAKTLFFFLCHGYFCYGARSRDYLRSLGAKPDYIYVGCQAAALPESYDAKAVVAERIRKRQTLRYPLFLYVGRLSKEKGLDTLIEAFAKFHGTCPRARLRIVGAGPERLTLERTVASLRLQEAVSFAGSLSGKALSQEYVVPTALVLPSMSEPWGLVVNESLAHGCPVVVSDKCGCVPELVHDGVTGYVFSAGNIEELTYTLDKAEKNFREVTIIAQNCIDVISLFTPRNAAESIARGCTDLLKI